MRATRRSILLLAAAWIAACLAAAACSDSTSADTRVAATVHVSPDSVSMRIGHVLQMDAVAVDSTGDTLLLRPVTWASSDTTIVVVSATGLATARHYGPVTITATVDSIAGSAALRVLVPVTGIDVAPFGATLVPGGGIQLTATLRGADGSVLSDRAIAWASQTPAVAAVDANNILVAGQVGSTSITASSEGVTSSGITYFVVQPTFVRLGAGEAAWHTCGVTAAGDAFCWGDNISGGLGNATFTDSGTTRSGLSFPTQVGGLELATTVGGGAGFTCGVGGSPARAFCWGAGDEYKLGSGPFENRPFAFPVSGGLAARDVAVGHEHSCLLTTESLTYCWGNGLQSPTLVPGGLKFGTIVSGDAVSCGITADSTGYCWPVSSVGVASPSVVPGGLKLVALTLGSQHRCAITADTLAYCLGQNADGQLGDSTKTFRTSWVPVTGGHKWATLAAGADFTCGLTTAGAAYCWGGNVFGELGSNAPAGATTPTAVAGGLVFTQLVAGARHACGLSTGGMAYCWGWNEYGQVGDGSKTNRFAPVRVAGQP